MKKLIALLLALVLVVGLVACGSADSGSNPDAAYTIGVCQLVQHEALDAATQGFVDALTEAVEAVAVRRSFAIVAGTQVIIPHEKLAVSSLSLRFLATPSSLTAV